MPAGHYTAGGKWRTASGNLISGAKHRAAVAAAKKGAKKAPAKKAPAKKRAGRGLATAVGFQGSRRVGGAFRGGSKAAPAKAATITQTNIGGAPAVVVESGKDKAIVTGVAGGAAVTAAKSGDLGWYDTISGAAKPYAGKLVAGLGAIGTAAALNAASRYLGVQKKKPAGAPKKAAAPKRKSPAVRRRGGSFRSGGALGLRGGALNLRGGSLVLRGQAGAGLGSRARFVAA